MMTYALTRAKLDSLLQTGRDKRKFFSLNSEGAEIIEAILTGRLSFDKIFVGERAYYGEEFNRNTCHYVIYYPYKFFEVYWPDNAERVEVYGPIPVSRLMSKLVSRSVYRDGIIPWYDELHWYVKILLHEAKNLGLRTLGQKVVYYQNMTVRIDTLDGGETYEVYGREAENVSKEGEEE